MIIFLKKKHPDINHVRHTKFFHLVASNRRRANFIGQLEVGSVVLSDPPVIKKVIELHFKNVYNKSDTIPVKSFDFELCKLSLDEASTLENLFSDHEVWGALFGIVSSKAPGPDGFNLGFLKKFWLALKLDVMIFFNNFYKGIGDFKAISLVGYVYKLLSKVLSNRLGKVSDSIIGPQQFAFCPGR
ncbi:hypothetical protein GQ457_08G025100 [Hibiscus cannabinus]